MRMAKFKLGVSISEFQVSSFRFQVSGLMFFALELET
jgi:hypothetical protein